MSRFYAESGAVQYKVDAEYVDICDKAFELGRNVGFSGELLPIRDEVDGHPFLVRKSGSSAGDAYRRGWEAGRKLAIQSGHAVKVKRGSKIVVAVLAVA